MNKLIRFLFEAKKLQNTLRFTKQADGRAENDAEHSWMVALSCLVLMPELEREFGKIDREKVLAMALIHDVAEIVTGDTKTWDNKARINKEEKEREAVEKLFGKLEKEKRDYLISLWEECEKQETVEAKFVKSIDRMDPVVHRIATGGGWHDVEEFHNGVENLDERQIPRHKFSKIMSRMYQELRRMAIRRKMFGD